MKVFIILVLEMAKNPVNVLKALLELFKGFPADNNEPNEDELKIANNIKGKLL